MSEESISLFDQEPLSAPERAHFDGDDYNPFRDDARLTGQIRRVWAVMRDGNWRTVNEICRLTGDPAPSVLAQLGHLRKEKFGAYLVDRRRVTETGLYEYRVGGKGEGTPMRRHCQGCVVRDAEIARLQAIIESRR